ncbi:MAG TPA: AAA family ATPase [Methylocella sp.]|jgi:hypothetical protein
MFDPNETPTPGQEIGAKNQITNHPSNLSESAKNATGLIDAIVESEPQDMRARAVSYAKKGYHVFRLEYDAKTPKRGSKGFYEGTSDPDVVRDRWSCADGSLEGWNIGIRGKGLCILDFDPKDQPIKELVAAFTEKYDTLPDSAVTKTPRAGRHLYLRCPEGTRVPNSAGMLFPGVDVRGDFGYVVAPGSHVENSVTGGATGDYTIVGRPDLMPVSELAEAPMWLIEVAWRAGNKSRAWGTFQEDNAPAPPSAASDAPDDAEPLESEYEVDTEAQIERARAWLRDEAPVGRKGEDGRATTRRIIQHLGDIGLTPPVTYDLLTEPGGWDATKSEPPWCRDEENRRSLETLVYDMLNKRDRPLGSGVHRIMIEDCFVAVEVDHNTPAARLLADFQAARAKGGRWRDFGEYSRAREEGRVPAGPPKVEAKQAKRDPWQGISAYNVGELLASECGAPLVEGLLEQEAFSVWVGAPKAGKSFLLLSLADAIAAGTPWAGRKTEQGLVVYVAAEGGRGVTKRLAALLNHHNRPKEHPLVVLRVPINLHSTENDARKIAAAVAVLEAKYGVVCRMIVIDTVSRALGGADEDTKGMGTLITRLDLIRDLTGSHLAAIHHFGKDEKRGARGSNTLLGALDSEFTVQPGVVSNPNQRDLERAESIKFRLRRVLAGIDNDGNPIFSAIAEVEGDRDAGEFIIPPTDDELDAFNCLCDAQEKVKGYDAETNSNPPVPVRDWSKAIKDAALAANQEPPDKRRVLDLRKSLINKKLVRALPGGGFELAPDGLVLRE